MKLLILSIILCFNNLSQAQIKKLTVKEFVDKSVSKRSLTIQEIESQLSDDSFYHSRLINKAVRFKMFLDAQEYVAKLYSLNCSIYNSQIAQASIEVNNAYWEGLQNANYLFKIAEKRKENFNETYEDFYKTGIKQYSELQNFSKAGCLDALTEINNRSKGIFNSDMGKNILSFNYIANPEKELEKNFQIFSSINNLPDTDFFFTIKIPQSWGIKNRMDFLYPSTVAYFEPYENFLNTNFSISIFSSPELISNVKSKKVSDEDLIQELYADHETLLLILSRFNKNVEKSKVETALFNYGNLKYIFYTTEVDLGIISKNDLTNGKILKSFNAIVMKDGNVLNLACGALINDNRFNTYQYYSKLFYGMITSLRFKQIEKNRIYLTEENNMKYITVTIDNLDYKFLLDTGASGILINKTILSNLIKSGTISQNNFIKNSEAEVADGRIVTTEEWLIPELKVGSQIIRDVIVNVVDSTDNFPLFGMDGLKKLNVEKLNLNQNEIIVNQEK